MEVPRVVLAQNLGRQLSGDESENSLGSPKKSEEEDFFKILVLGGKGVGVTSFCRNFAGIFSHPSSPRETYVGSVYIDEKGGGRRKKKVILVDVDPSVNIQKEKVQSRSLLSILMSFSLMLFVIFC